MKLGKVITVIIGWLAAMFSLVYFSVSYDFDCGITLNGENYRPNCTGFLSFGEFHKKFLLIYLCIETKKFKLKDDFAEFVHGPFGWNFILGAVIMILISILMKSYSLQQKQVMVIYKLSTRNLEHKPLILAERTTA
jgi:hypothetical protein